MPKSKTTKSEGKATPAKKTAPKPKVAAKSTKPVAAAKPAASQKSSPLKSVKKDKPSTSKTAGKKTAVKSKKSTPAASSTRSLSIASSKKPDPVSKRTTVSTKHSSKTTKTAAKPAKKPATKAASTKKPSKTPLPAKPAKEVAATKAAQTTSKAVASSNQKPVKSPPAPKVSISSLKVSQAKTDTVKANPQSSTHTQSAEPVKKATPAAASRKEISEEWVLQQRERIFELRDNLLESMHGVAKDTLRSRAEGSEASAFGMHQADAGSDSYDRDFALSLLSQEQDALYEIDEALKRIELGTYGICEMSGKVIMKARLEALPFARYTVECQSEVERQKKLHKARMPVTSLFGLTDEESSESEEEDQPIDAKD